MAKELVLGVGLASKLEVALNRHGIPDLADIDWLCEGDNLANVRRLRQGYATLTVQEHVIDCDAEPFLPKGWKKVEEHRKGGMFKWDKEAQKDALYLSDGQKNGKWMGGNKLREELKDKPVLNANVLDYLLANPHLIPEEWKGKYVFFWGTVYRHSNGGLFVRYLYWYGGRWRWDCHWLAGDWSDGDPAAVPAS